MKKEQYHCDVCGVQMGDQHERTTFSTFQLRAIVAEPGKVTKDIKLDGVETCHACADRVGTAMHRAGQMAIEAIKQAAIATNMKQYPPVPLATEPEPIPAPPQKKRGRPRKSVDLGKSTS